ncbi:MAG TPA: amidophosphoribosyltransferase [Clostridia bacterium]|nr:amidophosphoribosyltransferase [Clostridia bacterium]
MQIANIHEKCGVFAIYGLHESNIIETTYYALHALQHRGQASCGIAVSDGKEIRYDKGSGLVTERFEPSSLARLGGANIAIGHVRHSASHYESSLFAQPLVVNCRNGGIALAFNGSVTNRAQLRQELQQNGVLFQTDTDAELIINIISKFYLNSDLTAAIKSAMAFLKGSYSIILMTEREIYVVRDPHGNKPLAFGKLNGNWTVASETCVFDTIGAETIRDVVPGEIIRISDSGLESEYVPQKERKLCIYELIYFARPDSVIDGISVYEARREFGRKLAQVQPVDADLVIGVPDSALAAAAGYSLGSGIVYGDGLIKNRYTVQFKNTCTDLGADQSLRIKYNAIKENIAGKRIVLVDDSIVRGATSKYIIEILRASGAKEVHLRICSPAMTYSCPYGLYSKDSTQLIGSEYQEDEINSYLGADTFAYLPLGLMLDSLDEKSGFCTYCFDNKKY